MSAESSFAEILSQFEHEHHLDVRRAETIEGSVVAVTAESVFVDIARKTEGILPAAALPGIQPGDKLLVNVTGRDAEGYYTLSTIKLERPRDWSGLQLAFDEKRTIAGVVSELVKGGLRVDVGARAFLPASRSGARDQADLEKLIGQEIQCRITKLDTENEDIVVDRRVVLEEEEVRSRQQAFSQLAEGAIVRGSVRTITDFGAFVDLGGVDALLHVSDMSWARTAKPADVVAIGDSIEVKILKINAATRKISVGLKQLIPDPWAAAAEKFKVGDRVRGPVVRVTDFGAFVELQPGVDGLIHLSELSWSKKVRKPSDMLKPGDAVEVMVLSVNSAEHRIGLGLKQALGDPWDEIAKKFPAGSVVEGAVSSLTNFGAFVELGDGVEGMIHVADIAHDKRLDHPREALKPGQTVRAQVLEIDKEKRRIRLGMKQLVPTSVDEYIGEHKSGETVTGRIVDISGAKMKVELGEGVFATARVASPQGEQPANAEAVSTTADLSSLTAKLAAKWKTGPVQSTVREQLKPGQIRNFRLTSLDAAQKKIEADLL
ncbi:MAG: S1 RNA-binding domain-containing protein [Bryobacteraceae bacterium]